MHGARSRCCRLCADSTTIDLCLSLFGWRRFVPPRPPSSAHAADLRRPIQRPARLGGKLTRSRYRHAPLRQEASYVMDRGYVAPALVRDPSAGRFLRHQRHARMDARRVFSRVVDRRAGVIADQSVMLNGSTRARNTPSNFAASASKTPASARRWVFLTKQHRSPAATVAALYKSRCRSNSSSNGSNNTCASSVSRHQPRTPSRRKSGSLSPPTCGSHRQKNSNWTPPLYTCLQDLSSPSRKIQINAPFRAIHTQLRSVSQPQPTDSI